MSQLNISDWNILVVDDEPDNLNLLEDILSFYDARVISSYSGEEAIKLLDSQTFALALIDIQMPNVSGWDMIKHIRSSDKSEMRALVVIGVTAHAMPGDRERVLNYQEPYPGRVSAAAKYVLNRATEQGNFGYSRESSHATVTFRSKPSSSRRRKWPIKCVYCWSMMTQIRNPYFRIRSIILGSS